MTDIYALTEATWPPARAWREGPWMIRDGAGGGKRVSAATAEAPVQSDDIGLAEAKMEELGQDKLFQIRAGDEALDHLLDDRGYEIIDPVVCYTIPTATLAEIRPPKISAFVIWEPLKIMEELWAEGGIGPERLAVMARVTGPKTAVLGRVNDRASGAAFVAIHDGAAMIHAIEVTQNQRRQGTAVNMLREAGYWAQNAGARDLYLLVTTANEGANALYASLGMKIVGHYHYRIKKN